MNDTVKEKPFTISEAIIHQIFKKSNGNIKDQVRLSDDVLQITDLVKRFYKETTKSFQGQKTLGNFDVLNADYPHNYLKFIKGEQDFVAYTKEATNRLAQRINNTAAKGGYVAYFDVQNHERGRRELAVFLVRNTTSIQADESGEDIDLKDVKVIDTGRLHLAGIVDESKRILGEKPYLVFLQKNSSGVNEFFTDWYGATDMSSSKTQSEDFLRVVNHLPLPLDKNGKKIERHVLRAHISHIIEGNNNIIDIQKISTVVYDDDQLIGRVLAEMGLEVSSKFEAHNATLKNLQNLKISTDDIYLRMNRGDAARTISISEDKTSVIIRNEELVKEIATELELEKQDDAS